MFSRSRSSVVSSSMTVSASPAIVTYVRGLSIEISCDDDLAVELEMDRKGLVLTAYLLLPDDRRVAIGPHQAFDLFRIDDRLRCS